MSHLFTISAFTENQAGVLHRLTTVLTRRKVNIESLCVSETEQKGISRFTISIRSHEHLIKKLVAQIGRIIEVVRVTYHTDDELLFKEIAFFKVRVSDAAARAQIEGHAIKYGASIAIAAASFVVVEKTGREAEVDSLYHMLEPFGIIEFVRSGRIAMVKAEVEKIQLAERQIITSHGLLSPDGGAPFMGK